MGLCFSKSSREGTTPDTPNKPNGLTVKVLDMMTTIEYVHVSFRVKAQTFTETFTSCIRIADIPSSWTRQEIIDAAWKKREEDVHKWLKINERLKGVAQFVGKSYTPHRPID